MSDASDARTPSRRHILSRAAALAAGAAIARPGRTFGQAKATPAPVVLPDKLNVAVIGVHNRGAQNLAELAKVRSAHVVAICDIDSTFLDQAAAKLPHARKHHDFRQMLSSQLEIDAVLVSTPDHTHFHATLAALRAGKHVYCEKPLAHDVWEVRTLIEAAKKADVVTQLGTQTHAGENYRRVVELIRAGVIGTVKEVHVLIGDGPVVNDRPTDRPPIPANIDYDLWLGPAEPWDYHPDYLPFKWRRWWNFGSGKFGDFGCHYLDLPYWALNLSAPCRITPVAGPQPHPDGCPSWLTVRWDFERSASHGPLAITWHMGKNNRPQQASEWKLPEDFTGNVFVGDNGYLFASYTYFGPEAVRQTRIKADRIAPSIGHHAEWVKACLDNKPQEALCRFDYSGPLTQCVLLGCAAYRSGLALDWDDASGTVTNTRSADRFLRRTYRPGWEVDAV